MEPKETYEIRYKMAKMHDEMQERLEKAMESQKYVEVSWLCYSIMEQRITRMIEKHIAKCPREQRNNIIPAGISTRITCIKRLVNKKYGAYANVDHELIVKIYHWCKRRNKLVHSLLSLDSYREYDKDFKELAESGYPLAKQIYEEATKVREWSRLNEFSEFPLNSCRCSYKCIYEGEK